MDPKRKTRDMDLKQQLNKRGLRLTGQRAAVMDAVFRSKVRHVSCEDIFDIVRQSHPGIGLATVYRTLPLLEKMSFLNKVYLDDGRVRYEINTKEQLHHHLICMECGTVHEVKEDLLGILHKEIFMNGPFTIKNYMVKLYGCCSKCAKSN